MNRGNCLPRAKFSRIYSLVLAGFTLLFLFKRKSPDSSGSFLSIPPGVFRWHMRLNAIDKAKK